MRGIIGALLAVVMLGALAPSTAAAPGKYANFRTAIYVVVGTTKQLADPAEFARQYDRMQRQMKFDKVYVEAYRNHIFATDAELDAVKKAFEAKGIIVAGGITLAAGGKNGQFGTFDYEDPADRAECQKASELAARHFNEVILDDFFFYTSKSDADIAAKGDRSWTQYRLERMREVAQTLVIGPAKAANPAVKVIIKYPNWYPHFQGLGYDLDKEAQLFDGIYTGTETRDPFVTDQLLQQYESYGIIRYFDNIRPTGFNGGNGGGWVDTYSVRYVDRYAEQLWGTLFAKAREITLFNWHDLVDPQYKVDAGARQAWAKRPTSFSWADMARGFTPAGKGDSFGWGRVAGYSLEQVDAALGDLGNPIGIPSYKPYQSDGEDFLQHYLGNIGIPIEMTPTFPTGAKLVLLTEEAKYDPDIIKKIDAQLKAGGNVVITSGFLRAMQNKGFRHIAEWDVTGRVIGIREFIDGFGAGNGTVLNDKGKPQTPILFPEVHFYTNDSWGIIRGTAGSKGNPILLMNGYSKGTIYLLNIPDNPADLYQLPQGALSQIRHYLMPEFQARIEAPALVSLFAYDNGTIAVESFRDAATAVNVVVPGAGVKLRDLKTGKLIAAKPQPQPVPDKRGRIAKLPPVTIFPVSLEAHSFRTYRIER
jgi:hypothetical protein